VDISSKMGQAKAWFRIQRTWAEPRTTCRSSSSSTRGERDKVILDGGTIVRYRTTPTFSVRDASGHEWRIRRAITFKSPWRPRWRVEQRTVERWILCGIAQIRHGAEERLQSLSGAASAG